jgi:hypothetical protein
LKRSTKAACKTSGPRSTKRWLEENQDGTLQSSCIVLVFLFIEAEPLVLGLGLLRKFLQNTPYLCLPITTGARESLCLVILSDAEKTLGHVTGNRLPLLFLLLSLEGEVVPGASP